MKEQRISENFAKELLTECYALDVRFRDLEAICLSSCESHKTGELKKLFTDLVTMVGSRFMVPLYQQHPHLGRIMEPGSWLEQDPKRGKFGVRD